MYLDSKKVVYGEEKERMRQWKMLLQQCLDDIKLIKNDCVEDNTDRFYNIENILSMLQSEFIVKEKTLGVTLANIEKRAAWRHKHFSEIIDLELMELGSLDLRA